MTVAVWEAVRGTGKGRGHVVAAKKQNGGRLVRSLLEFRPGLDLESRKREMSDLSREELERSLETFRLGLVQAMSEARGEERSKVESIATTMGNLAQDVAVLKDRLGHGIITPADCALRERGFSAKVDSLAAKVDEMAEDAKEDREIIHRRIGKIGGRLWWAFATAFVGMAGAMCSLVWSHVTTSPNPAPPPGSSQPKNP